MKVGLIGNGYWGSIVEQKVKKLHDLKFIANSKTNLNEIIDSVDSVFICTPTNTHYDIVKYCITKHKNIFCEKPFTGSLQKAKELLTFAKKENVSIIIDHVFLYRKEYNKIFNGNKFKFTWNKPENIKENIIDSLLYHDLYMLIHSSGMAEWDIISKNITNTHLTLKLKNNKKIAEFVYNRQYPYKEKKIEIDNIEVDFSNPQNDALYDIIKKFPKEINLEENNNLCCSVLQLKQKILQDNYE